MADATAKFLAGLPVRGTPLEKHSSGTMWVTHATEFDRAWERLEQRQLARIRNWAPSYLAPAYEENGPMFYMFSGPDFLYANAFFPNASTYILCGIEPVGPVPDIDKIPDSVLPSALANLRKSLDSVLSFSFFITKNMKVDLKQTQLNGTLPVLYVFLARAGCTIDSVTPVALDKAGSFVPEGKGATSGVKIVFFEPDGREKTLYYFTSDLADWAVKVNPGFLKFCETQGQGVALLGDGVAAGVEFLDDSIEALHRLNTLGYGREGSGLTLNLVYNPVGAFLPGRQASLEADFRRELARRHGIVFNNLFVITNMPINRFLEHGQLNLAKQNGATNPPPLDFSFGYQWQPSRSSLMIATPKD